MRGRVVRLRTVGVDVNALAALLESTGTADGEAASALLWAEWTAPTAAPDAEPIPTCHDAVDESSLEECCF